MLTLQWLSSSLQKSLFTFSNDHDIAQETVIELIQQEVDEEVSLRHRNWRDEEKQQVVFRLQSYCKCITITHETIDNGFCLRKVTRLLKFISDVKFSCFFIDHFLGHFAFF